MRVGRIEAEGEDLEELLVVVGRAAYMTWHCFNIDVDSGGDRYVVTAGPSGAPHGDPDEILDDGLPAVIELD